MHSAAFSICDWYDLVRGHGSVVPQRICSNLTIWRGPLMSCIAVSNGCWRDADDGNSAGFLETLSISTVRWRLFAVPHIFMKPACKTTGSSQLFHFYFLSCSLHWPSCHFLKILLTLWLLWDYFTNCLYFYGTFVWEWYNIYNYILLLPCLMISFKLNWMFWMLRLDMLTSTVNTCHNIDFKF